MQVKNIVQDGTTSMYHSFAKSKFVYFKLQLKPSHLKLD